MSIDYDQHAPIVEAVLDASGEHGVAPIEIDGVGTLLCTYRCFIAFDEPAVLPEPDARWRTAFRRETGYRLSQALDWARQRAGNSPWDSEAVWTRREESTRRHTLYWRAQFLVINELLTVSPPSRSSRALWSSPSVDHAARHWLQSSRWRLETATASEAAQVPDVWHVTSSTHDERTTQLLLKQLVESVVHGEWDGHLANEQTGTVLVGKQRPKRFGSGEVMDLVVGQPEPSQAQPLHRSLDSSLSHVAPLTDESVAAETGDDLKLVDTAIREARAQGRPLDENFIRATAEARRQRRQQTGSATGIDRSEPIVRQLLGVLAVEHHSLGHDA